MTESKTSARMGTMNTNAIIKFIEDNPRCTAKEAGTTTVFLKELEAQGLVENVGVRATGRRGRPSVEWALPGIVAEEDQTGRISCGIPGAPSLPDLSGLLPRLNDEDARVVSYVQRIYANPGGREKRDIVLLYNSAQRIVKKVGVNMDAVVEEEA